MTIGAAAMSATGEEPYFALIRSIRVGCSAAQPEFFMHGAQEEITGSRHINTKRFRLILGASQISGIESWFRG